MGDKGKRDKGKREEQKKGKHTLKEKRKQKKQKGSVTYILPDRNMEMINQKPRMVARE